MATNLNISDEGNNIANRLDALQQSGYKWMDPTLQVHLATSATSVPNMLSTAETYKNSLDNTGDGATLAIDDVATRKNPSIVDTALSTLHNIHGSIPVLQSDLSVIQKNLQAKGYGVGLPVGNGWDAGWAQALNQHGYDSLTKPGVGNVKSLPLWSSILKEIQPPQWSSQAAHYIASIPKQISNMMADAVGQFSGSITSNPFDLQQMKKNVAANTAGLKNAIGEKTTPQQEQAQSLQNSLQDLNNLFILIGAGKLIKGTAVAVGDVGKAIATKASEEGIGAAAKGLFTRSLPEEFAGQPKFTLVKSLYQGAGEGGVGRLAWLENVPVLKAMLPLLGRASEEGSAYYTAKQVAASWMRNPLRQIGSIAQSKGFLAGLGLLGDTEAEKALGVTPTYDASATKPFAGEIANIANDLSFFVGSPTKMLAPSKNVGQVVGNAHQALQDLAGPMGLDYIFKKAYGVSLEDMYKNVGQEAVDHMFINTKLNQFAANHYADQAIKLDYQDGKFEPYSSEAQAAYNEYRHVALNDPALLSDARNSLLQQKDVLPNMYKKDATSTLGKNVLGGIENPYNISDKDKSRWYNSLKNLWSAHTYMGNILKPDYRNWFIGTSGMKDLEDIRSAKLADEWTQFLNDGKPWQEANNGQKFFHINKQAKGFMPDTNTLVKKGNYGSGVPVTDNINHVGRIKSKVFSITHDATGAEPKTLDLNNPTLPSFALKDVIGGLLAGNQNKFLEDGTTANQLRDELGLMKPGKGKNTLVSVGKDAFPQDVKTLQSMIKNRFKFSGQDILDQYRKSLVSAGKLNKDQIDSRIDSVMQKIMKDGQYTGYEYMHDTYGKQYMFNPNFIRAKLMNPQDAAISKEALTPGYIAHNNINGYGTVGLANKSKMTSQGIRDEVNKMFKQLTKLGYGDAVTNAKTTLELEDRTGKLGKLPSLGQAILPNSEEAKILQNAYKLLTRDIGKDSNEIIRFDDPIKAASVLWHESKNLASDAFLPENAPAELKQWVSKLDDLGYKIVLGTDIGHTYEAPLVAPPIIERRTNLLKKLALGSGMDVSRVSDHSTNQATHIAISNELNNLFASGKVNPAFGDTGDSILHMIRSAIKSGAVETEGRLSRGFKGFIDGMREPKMHEQNMGNTAHLTDEEIAAAKAETTKKIRDTYNTSKTLRDISDRKMVKFLTTPRPLLNSPGEVASRYSKADAWQIVRAIQRGYAKSPVSYRGLSKAEDFFRASGAIATHATASFMGKVPLLNNFKLGDGHLASALHMAASIPNDLARLRDKWRFDYSPIFALRRLVKTNVKAATEGVPTSMRPYSDLNKMGVLDDAFKLLARVKPAVFNEYKNLDNFDKFIEQSDIFGLYNPAHAMAWQAYNLQKAGLSEAEIAQKLEKINTYGDRTPLEKTVNTLFYPFSFNKTLYRNIGGYLLDNPGQTALINAGFNLYQHYDANNQLGGWVKKHAPLLQELQKLNAFEHGTGLGQFYGLNAPYINEFMNLFSPQQITPNNAGAALKAWTSAVPALSELNSVLFGYNPKTNTMVGGSLPQTATAGFWAANNSYKDFLSLFTNKEYAMHTTLTPSAQILAAQDAIASLKVQAQANGWYNNSAYSWPNTNEFQALKIAGKKYDATTIGKYVSSFYPAYDPSKAYAISTEKARQEDNYINSLQGDPIGRYEAYNQFRTLADAAVTKINRASDPTVINNVIKPLREIAINIAEQDPKFVKFYRTFYQSKLGPIEELKY
jgi:hypothetical protein